MKLISSILTALLLAILAGPFAAEAQQTGKVVTIGILAIEAWPPIDSFRQGLHDLGYIEGKNGQPGESGDSRRIQERGDRGED